jgi:hypothetical protein
LTVNQGYLGSSPRSPVTNLKALHLTKMKIFYIIYT